MAATTQIRTREQFRNELRRHGLSIAAWARKQNVKPQQVRDVLREEALCQYGISHKIAVLMGIKDGVIDDC